MKPNHLMPKALGAAIGAAMYVADGSVSPALKLELDKFATAFEAFKTANDERLVQIEAKGSADPLLSAQVEAANTAVTDIQARIKTLQEDSEKRIDEIEARLQRPNFGSAGGADDPAAVEMQNAQAFYMQVAGQRGREFNPEAVDVEAYRNYRSALDAYYRMGQQGLTPGFTAALSVGADPAGGYWVTPDSTGRIAMLVRETSPMRDVAAIQVIGTDSLQGINDLDEAASGWVGEAETRGDTDTPEVGQWEIFAREQYAQPKATQKLLDDANVNVEAWLEGKVASKFNRTENTAFVTGDGTKRPRGFLTYTAGVPTAAAWEVIEQVNSGASGAFAASDPGDKLIDLVFKLKGDYRGNARFAMNRRTVGEVRKLKDGQGNYLWQPNFTATAGGLLLGFPISEFDDMPDLAANSLSLAFGDFQEGYQVVDRAGIRILRDPFTQKGYVKFYSTKRTGGGVVNFEAIKIMKFAA